MIYNFQSDYTVDVSHRQGIPPGLPEIPAIRQTSNSTGRRTDIPFGRRYAYPYHIDAFTMPGFHALDEAMKLYWSGMRIPTKDSYRFMRIKIAGGDKSVMVWADERKDGRAILPVASLNRASWDLNPDKWSPPYHAMTTRFLSRRGDLSARVYRPMPFLVEYTMSIWAERKQHIEYLLYQIETRLNQLGEFRMFDGHLNGNVQIRRGGTTDASDKEAGFDQHPMIKYEVNMTAEAWLPLPETVVPTILGIVHQVKDPLTNLLVASLGSGVAAGAPFTFTPVTE